MLSRIVEESGSSLFGRIGFVDERELATLIFDENLKDFRHGVAPSGVVVPFGISVADGLIAYQLRPGIVRENTFVGAFDALLNLNSNEYLWQVETLAENASFEQWLGRQSRLIHFDVRLERPNPHYHGNDIAERIIEEVRLEYARIVGVERDGEGVDTRSELFQQALDHVLREYGRASLRGLDPQGEESTWVKLRGRLGRIALRRRRLGVGGEDAPLEVIRAALFDAPRSTSESLVLSDGDGDERFSV